MRYQQSQREITSVSYLVKAALQAMNAAFCALKGALQATNGALHAIKDFSPITIFNFPSLILDFRAFSLLAGSSSSIVTFFFDLAI